MRLSEASAIDFIIKFKNSIRKNIDFVLINKIHLKKKYVYSIAHQELNKQQN